MFLMNFSKSVKTLRYEEIKLHDIFTINARILNALSYVLGLVDRRAGD